MALLDSRQLNPRLTGSFTLSGSLAGDSASTGSFGKLLGDGPPEGEDITVVYEVRDVFEAPSRSNFRIKKICIPVEYRHHFERSVPPPQANPYMYLEKKSDGQAEANRSVVDDFGVHSVSCQTFTKVLQLISRYEFSIIQKIFKK